MDERESDGNTGSGRRSLISDGPKFLVYFAALPVFAGLLLSGFISTWNCLNAVIIVGATLVAAIGAGYFGFSYIEAIPVWGTVALLVSVAINAYDHYSARKRTNTVGMAEFLVVHYEGKLQPRKALLLMANSRRSLFVPELGR